MKSLYESIFDTDFEPTVANTKAKPRSKAELQRIIDEHIKKLNPRPGQEVDLNWIDISGVDDLSEVFKKTDYIPVIDTWKIDHVRNFVCMFAENKCITRSPLPVLQEKLLFKECYDRMFYGCASLKEPPALPAMKLKQWCYNAMFYGCTSLVEPPELPAMKLDLGCYRRMFTGCASLELAPELPAIQPTKDCYDYMFQGCISLKNKAKVPTKVDTNNTSYACGMYDNCPNIK